MIVLGVHCGFTIHTHEPGAALSINGKIVACCEEERYSRNKNAIGLLPNYSISAVLKIAKIDFKKINLIVSTGITSKNYSKTLKKYFNDNFGCCPKILIVDHHLSHVASAFYSSGFEKATCLSLDAFGDKKSGLIAEANLKTGIKPLKYISSKNSLGNFYSAATEFLGYSDGDEYKVMGLASYGKPNINLDQVLYKSEKWWKLNGKFFVNQKTPFEHRYSEYFINKYKKYKRKNTEKITVSHKNFAASVQSHIVKFIKKAFLNSSKMSNYKNSICYAGGVALNCSAVKEILYSNIFQNIYIPPNPSDRGLALGCAYLGSVHLKDKIKPIASPYLGSQYSDKDIKKELINNNSVFKKPKNICSLTAKLLSKGKIIGWYQGRSEIGARALGNRSILADPSKRDMKEILNKKIKYREEFRPFAPAVLEEHANKYFNTNNSKIPFMNCTVNANKKFIKKIYSAVHIDGTSRVQTVSKKMNIKFYNLINSFYKITGVPILINTSFNLKGQPIVETPRDALMTFYGSGIDYLVLGSYLISKK